MPVPGSAFNVGEDMEEKIAIVQRLFQEAEQSPSRCLAAMRKLWNYCSEDDYKRIVARHEGINALQRLVGYIHSDDGTFLGLSNAATALGVLWFVSRAEKVPLVDPRLNLIPTLVQYLQFDNPLKEYAIKILSNCSIDPLTHPVLLSETLGLIPACRIQLSRVATNRYIYQSFHCLTTGILSENVHLLIKHNVHGLVMTRLLQSGSNPTRWESRGNGPEYYGLTFLANFSALPQGAKVLEEWDQPNYFLDMLRVDAMERLKAAVVLVNTFAASNKYSSINRLVLRNCPTLLPYLEKILKVTLSRNMDPVANQLVGTFFHFGMVRLRSLSLFLRNLALDEENRGVLLESSTEIISLALQFLEAYVKNEPELSIRGSIAVEYGGGGGNDHESALYLLEFLILLFRDDRSFTMRMNCLEGRDRSLFQNFTSLLTLGTDSTGRMVPQSVIQCSQLFLELLE